MKLPGAARFISSAMFAKVNEYAEKIPFPAAKRWRRHQTFVANRLHRRPHALIKIKAFALPTR
ncbi:hypothetical protein [Chromobacterium sphagni]|uniref:hypothetical protein n=1 Tax=Chromobacterium sphagni TaxID=1903179 RepID=UPI0019D35F56|nr:hypothetical protein [Chromobacterium sphagni]